MFKMSRLDAKYWHRSKSTRSGQISRNRHGSIINAAGVAFFRLEVNSIGLDTRRVSDQMPRTQPEPTMKRREFRNVPPAWRVA